MKQYAERDVMELDIEGGYYARHVEAMTVENLHEKSAIAAELAWRDARIARLIRQRNELGAIADRLCTQIANMKKRRVA